MSEQKQTRLLVSERLHLQLKKWAKRQRVMLTVAADRALEEFLDRNKKAA